MNVLYYLALIFFAFLAACGDDRRVTQDQTTQPVCSAGQLLECSWLYSTFTAEEFEQEAAKYRGRFEAQFLFIFGRFFPDGTEEDAEISVLIQDFAVISDIEAEEGTDINGNPLHHVLFQLKLQQARCDKGVDSFFDSEGMSFDLQPGEEVSMHMVANDGEGPVSFNTFFTGWIDPAEWDGENYEQALGSCRVIQVE